MYARASEVAASPRPLEPLLTQPAQPQPQAKAFLRIGGPFTRNVAVLAGGTALGQAVTVAVTPLLTRLYSPADMGHFGVFNATVGVGAIFLSLRYEAAIVSAEPGDVAAVTTLSTALVVPASILVALVSYGGARAGVLGLGDLGALTIALLAPTLVVAGLANVLRYWFIRKQNLRPVSLQLALQNSVRALAQLGLGLLKATSAGLAMGDAIGRSAGAVGLAPWRILCEVRKAPQALTGAGMYSVARKYRAFSTYFLLSSVINVLAVAIPVPLMAAGFGSEAAGQLSLGQRVIAGPMALLAGTFADAFHGKLAALARENPAAAARFFWKSTWILLAVAVVPTLAFTCFSRWLFPVIFGTKWAVAGDMASIMGPWILVSFVVSPLSRAVLVYDGQRMKLIYDIAALALAVGAFKMCEFRHASAIETVGVLAALQTLSYVVYFAILVVLVRRGTSGALRP